MVALTAADKDAQLASMKDKVAEAGMVVPATMQPDGDVDAVRIRYLRVRNCALCLPCAAATAETREVHEVKPAFLWLPCSCTGTSRRMTVQKQVPRRLNVDQALKQLSDTLASRKQNDVDSYLFRRLSPEEEASLRRHQHSGHIGTDKQGRPIHLEYSAQTNILGLTAGGVTTEDFVFASVRQMEYLVCIKLEACQKAAGLKLGGHVVISVRQVFIDEGTQTKVLFVDKQGTELLAAIDAAVLPASMAARSPLRSAL